MPDNSKNSQATQILTNFTPADLGEWFAARGEKPARALVVCKNVYQRFCDAPDLMIDVAGRVRLLLNRDFHTPKLEIASRKKAVDGTVKYALGLHDGHRVEAVMIPDVGRKAGKVTLCLSTQVGCAMRCAFCLTGKSGLTRNLETWEIVEQFRLIAKDISRPVTHIVFMGMGEPLHNLANLKKALRILTDPAGAHLPASRITVSTSGLVPQIQELKSEFDVRLAVTLSAPNNDIRSPLMPINRGYPLEALLECIAGLRLKKKERVFFEYVLLAGVNDSDEQARELAERLQGLPCKVNLIPFNEIPEFPFVRPSKDRVFRFLAILKQKGLSASIRVTRGEDVMAACGQLSESLAGQMHGSSL